MQVAKLTQDKSTSYIIDVSNVKLLKVGFKKALFSKNVDFDIALKTAKTLSRFIKNNKDKSDKKCQSGIYSLFCGSCPTKYIGQTVRSFYIIKLPLYFQPL